MRARFFANQLVSIGSSMLFYSVLGVALKSPRVEAHCGCPHSPAQVCSANMGPTLVDSWWGRLSQILWTSRST